jgi:hypothetical protein
MNLFGNIYTSPDKYNEDSRRNTSWQYEDFQRVTAGLTQGKEKTELFLCFAGQNRRGLQVQIHTF